MENKKYNFSRNYWIMAAIFIAAKLSIHLFASCNYELHRDEMLYFNMGSHPALGYLTVPPVTGFLAFLVKNIFGYSVFGIRLIPALFGAATLFIIAKTVKELGGGITALSILALTFIFMPGYLLLFSLFTPNACEIFFWTLAIYLLFRLAKTENPRLWIWIGIVLGLSFNTKYSIAFVAAGFLPALLIFPQRKLLLSWWFLAGIAVALFFVLPNIIWQFNHNWPVLYHFEELKKTQISNLKYSDFFIDLFSLNSALILVWLSGLGFLLFNETVKKYRFLGFGILFTLLIFIVLKGKAYYVLGLLPGLIAFGGFFIEKYIKQKIWILAGMAILLVYSLLSLPFVLPVLSYQKLEKYSELTKGWITTPFMRWEDGKERTVSQVYADMTGWRELAGIAAKAYNSLATDEKQNCTVFCERNYGYAGVIHFYGHEYNLPEPVTFHESYIFWAPDSIAQEPVIYVNYNSDDFQTLFNEITEIGSVQNPYFREKGVKVFLCRNPKTDINEVYKTSIFNERKRFIRNLNQ
ncbi:hypothetical protein MASR2M47_25850 [Draconibacterium sp.]